MPWDSETAGGSPSPGSPSLQGGSCPLRPPPSPGRGHPSAAQEEPAQRGGRALLSHPARVCPSSFGCQVARSLKRLWVHPAPPGGRGGESQGETWGGAATSQREAGHRGAAGLVLLSRASPGAQLLRDARSSRHRCAGAAAPGGAPRPPAGKGVPGARGGAGGPERPLPAATWSRGSRGARRTQEEGAPSPPSPPAGVRGCGGAGRGTRICSGVRWEDADSCGGALPRLADYSLIPQPLSCGSVGSRAAACGWGSGRVR